MPVWKKWVINIFWSLFFVCCLCGIASIFYFFSIWDAASPVATLVKSVPLTNHGKTVYITENEFFWYAVLFRTAFGGAVSLIAVGFLLRSAGIEVAAEPSEKESAAVEKILDCFGLKEHLRGFDKNKKRIR